MISEGSCDTEDWSNDAENSTLITGFFNIYIFFRYIKCNTFIFNCNDISLLFSLYYMIK